MRISISSEPRLLHILRSVVRWRSLEAGFPPSDAEYLALAIDEAAANVIRHVYGARPDATLALEIKSFVDRIEFALEDRGPKVKACDIQPRPLDDIRPGGLGTYFIRCFMDVSSYDESFAEGNRLRLVKYLPRKGSAIDEGSSQKRQ
jgi:anti-sigma regulatory factor (Ser/Thr protein kinase)